MTHDEKSVEKTLRYSLFEGGFTQVFITWTTGSVLIGFMLFYGATPTQIGIIGSVPLLAQISSPFVAWRASRLTQIRGLTVLMATVGRALWILAAFIPLIGLSTQASVWFIISLTLISSFFQASTGVLWTSWMGDVIPVKKRGKYMGTRTALVGIIGMVAGLTSGLMLDSLPEPLNFQIIFSVAVAFAGISVLFLRKHYERSGERNPVSLKYILTRPWRDEQFKDVLIFGIYWHVAIFISAPLIFAYFINHLGMSFTDIAIWAAIAALSAMVITPLWGRVADTFGNRPVLAIGTFLAGSVLPLCWLVATPGNLGPIWLAGVMDALAWGAAGPALFNLLIATTNKANRTAFVATYSALTGLFGFMAGILSGPLYTLFLNTEGMIGNYQWTAFHTLIVLSGCLRMMAWVFVRPIKEADAWRVRAVLARARMWRLSGLPWRSTGV